MIDPLGLRKADRNEEENGGHGGGDGGEGELSAVGLEGMLEALEVANQRTDRETLGAKVGVSAWSIIASTHERACRLDYWWKSILK